MCYIIYSLELPNKPKHLDWSLNNQARNLYEDKNCCTLESFIKVFSIKYLKLQTLTNSSCKRYTGLGRDTNYTMVGM